MMPIGRIVLLGLLASLTLAFQAQALSGARDEGTFHERMVKRLENLSEKWETATPFLEQALQALHDNHYEILSYQKDHPKIHDSQKALFQQFNQVLAATFQDKKQVILRVKEIHAWSKREKISKQEAIDRVLINEMVHVVLNSAPSRRSILGASKDLRFCLNLHQSPPSWEMFKERVTEEVLSQLVGVIIESC